MLQNTDPVDRVIGLDAHPDTFTAALVRGTTPAAALVEQCFNKVPLRQLPGWAHKHTTPKDLFVLEASGNSFHIVRVLAEAGRRALVLESCQMGKLKESHANNDKISAVRIAKAYLAGTAKIVWVPDLKTQERRDLFHAHRKATKRTTQVRNRLLSYLSDQGVRLPKNTPLVKPQEAEAKLQEAKRWSPCQWQIIEGLLLELRHADQQRTHWRRLIAQEVLADPTLLSLVHLCGIREMVAFALGAIIGDIHRFAHPGQLVKYIGLNPAFDDSGNERWSGGIGGHGRKDLRCLLIEAAQAILRCSKTPLALWGKKLLARKGSINLAVAAIARKLTVAVWYQLMGRGTPLPELEPGLKHKVGKIISQVGPEGCKKLGKTRAQLREETYQLLKASIAVPPPSKQTPAPPPALPAETKPAARVYVLKPDLKDTPKSPKSQPQPLTAG